MKDTLTRVLLCMFLLLPMACSDSGKKPSGNATAAGTAARSKPFHAFIMREPFHASTCRWAEKITSANLVGYDTREQAVADGHRPCKVCKP